MNKINIFFDKILEKIPGWVFGVLAALIGIVCDIIAVLSYPDYDWTTQVVSELGVGSTAYIFNFGSLIIPGLLAIPFVIYIGKAFENENVNERIRKTTLIVSIVYCIACALIGVFPSIPGQKIIIFIHGLSALTCWLGGLLFLILLSIQIPKNPTFSNYLIYINCFFMCFYVVFLITWIPQTEWAVHVAIKFWVLIIALYCAYNKL